MKVNGEVKCASDYFKGREKVGLQAANAQWRYGVSLKPQLMGTSFKHRKQAHGKDIQIRKINLLGSSHFSIFGYAILFKNCI